MLVARHDPEELRRSYLLIALFPTIIICASDALFNAAGSLNGAQALFHPAAADPYRELAAQLRVATAFMLLVGACIAAATYFILLFREAERATKRATLAAAAAAVAIVLLYFLLADDPQTQQSVGQAFYCEAASWLGQPPVVTGPAAPPVVFKDTPGDCEGKAFDFIRTLVTAQQLGLAAAIPAVVFSSILCLRERRRNGNEPAEAAAAALEDRRHLAVQINRLNLVLYITAVLLVSGLLFLGAFLHYPGYALGGERGEPFRAAVQAIVLFYAISYSLLIASFYIPVAGILAHRCAAVALPEQKSAEAESKDGIFAPQQLVKTGIAILSPLLAGLVTEIVKLPGT